MNILYDSQMFLKQKYGGITKYFCELMKNLPSGYEFKLSVLLSENQHLKDDYNFFKKWNISLSGSYFRGKGRIKTGLYNLNRSYSKYLISRDNFDLLHPTYYDPYFLDYKKKPYILTVHDLIQFQFKENYKTNSLIPQMEKIIKNATRIISISENTKKDLIEILNIHPEKIDVIYHGFNRPSVNDTLNIYGRYILYVGYRGGYKNFSNLLKAFHVLASKDDDLKLICVGNPFTRAEKEELLNLEISEKVMIIGANENTLNMLYANALAFVYPTLYEGFGMSILEAFANNCPVCLGKTSSLPEVAGEAGVYFNPYNYESILETIEKVIYNTDFSNKMIEAGNERLNYFSWKKCAEETSRSYEQACS